MSVLHGCALVGMITLGLQLVLTPDVPPSLISANACVCMALYVALRLL